MLNEGGSMKILKVTSLVFWQGLLVRASDKNDWERLSSPGICATHIAANPSKPVVGANQ